MGDFLSKISDIIILPLCFMVVGGVAWFAVTQIEFNLWPIISFVFLLLPLFLPVVLFYLTYEEWVGFVQAKSKYNTGRITLRIKPPPEVFKSPEAMESVLAQIHNGSKADTLMEAYIDGKHPIPNSFEIVSIGGDVRIYANVPRKVVKDILESQLYAQYPGIEITEEPLDYAAEIKWLPDEMDLMSFHIVKAEDQVIPIKTYIDFGLDKMPKEEEKYEPMSAMIEFLSTAKPHERLIYQIICEPHIKKSFSLGTSLNTVDTWVKEAKEKINELLQRDDKRLGTTEETENRPTLTMGERDLIAAIERNTGKLAYNVGIRAMYITLDKTQFDGSKISPLLKAFYPYDDLNRNQLGVRWKTAFDYKLFEDFSGSNQIDRKKKELEHFKLRKYSAGKGSSNKVHKPKVLSVEELATIFHIPGRSIVTPRLARVPATMGNTPENLPIGNLSQK